MVTATISSKGQIVLPADIRRRLGLLAGTQVEVVEQSDGVRLVVAHPIKTSTITACAGMVTAPSKGTPRRLSDFDPATLANKAQP